MCAETKHCGVLECSEGLKVVQGTDTCHSQHRQPVPHLSSHPERLWVNIESYVSGRNFECILLILLLLLTKTFVNGNCSSHPLQIRHRIAGGKVKEKDVVSGKGRKKWEAKWEKGEWIRKPCVLLQHQIFWGPDTSGCGLEMGNKATREDALGWSLHTPGLLINMKKSKRRLLSFFFEASYYLEVQTGPQRRVFLPPSLVLGLQASLATI